MPDYASMSLAGIINIVEQGAGFTVFPIWYVKKKYPLECPDRARVVKYRVYYFDGQVSDNEHPPFYSDRRAFIVM